MSAQPDAKAAAQAVHTALEGYLEDGELVVGWAITMDIAGTDDRRYLAHRYGGGHDGSQSPTVWTSLGMLRAAMQVAERQLGRWTDDIPDDIPDDNEDDD